MLGYSFTQHIYICLAIFSFTEVLCIYLLEASFANFISAQCNVHMNKQSIVRHIKMFQKWSFYVEVNLFVRNNKSRCKEDKKKLWSHNWNERNLWKPNVNILEKPNNKLLFFVLLSSTWSISIHRHSISFFSVFSSMEHKA